MHFIPNFVRNFPQTWAKLFLLKSRLAVRLIWLPNGGIQQSSLSSVRIVIEQTIFTKVNYCGPLAANASHGGARLSDVFECQYSNAVDQLGSRQETTRVMWRLGTRKGWKEHCFYETLLYPCENSPTLGGSQIMPLSQTYILNSTYTLSLTLSRIFLIVIRVLHIYNCGFFRVYTTLPILLAICIKKMFSPMTAVYIMDNIGHWSRKLVTNGIQKKQISP